MELPTCPICRRHALASARERARDACDRCAIGTGLWIAAPDVRPPVPCRGCGHDELVRSLLRERAAAEQGEYLAPVGVAFTTRVARVGAAPAARSDPDDPIGTIVAYVCRRCGLTELYTAGARDLPIGPEYGTALVRVGRAGPDDGGPFR